jgi:hypothetical protein
MSNQQSDQQTDEQQPHRQRQSRPDKARHLRRAPDHPALAGHVQHQVNHPDPDRPMHPRNRLRPRGSILETTSTRGECKTGHTRPAPPPSRRTRATPPITARTPPSPRAWWWRSIRPIPQSRPTGSNPAPCTAGAQDASRAARVPRICRRQLTGRGSCPGRVRARSRRVKPRFTIMPMPMLKTW